MSPNLRCILGCVHFLVVLSLVLQFAPALSFAPPLRLVQTSFREVVRNAPTCSTLPRMNTAHSSSRMSRMLREYTEAADEASWQLANEDNQCSVENAMYSGLVESTEIAATLVEYMEECNSANKKISQSASDVLRSLISHQTGAQGFWTTFLTDPDLHHASVPPFDPGLVSAVARFPELNMGVLSSCLAMSATEETVYVQDGEELMRENAAMSRIRILRLLADLTRQPDSRSGMHGNSWLLDLIDYDLLDQCVETAEMRGFNGSEARLEPALGIFSSGDDSEQDERERASSQEKEPAVLKTNDQALVTVETEENQIAVIIRTGFRMFGDIIDILAKKNKEESSGNKR